MQPRSTIWELEPHTAAKHEILRRYLQAWVPILSQGRFPQLVIVDGFAGPGRYSKGEEGSPIICLKAVTEQPRPIKARVDFHFIELDSERALHLQNEVAAINLPDHVRATIHGSRTFQDAFPQVWAQYEPGSGRKRPPTFVFIDPFGFKIPLSYVARVLRAQSCEVLVNFMFEEINRFVAQKQMPPNFDELFGCSDWRACIEMTIPRERVKFLHDLYQRQLIGAAGAKFVRSFAMRNSQNRMDYFLFFASNNELGLRKMKEAMWKVDESGTYTFSDATDPDQSVLFAAEPDRSLLSRMIVGRFAGSETTPAEIEQYVVVQTPFTESHYKRVLASLEAAGALTAINVNPKRRSGTFADPQMPLRFAPNV